MNIKELDKISALGFPVRTKNVDETNLSTAKIGALWGKFYLELVPKIGQNSRIWPLYKL